MPIQQNMQDQPGGINWVDYNYPPFIHVVHYTPSELPSNIATTVRRLHLCFMITVIGVFLNLLDTIIIAAAYSEAQGIWVLYSILNIILFPMVAFYVFYVGYKGLATCDSNLLNKYLIGASVLAGLFLFLFLVPFGSINGVLKGTKYTVTGYWVFAVILESILWLGNLIVTIANMWAVRNDFDPYKSTTGATSIRSGGRVV